MLREILYIIIFSEGMMQGAFKSLLHSTLIIVNWEGIDPQIVPELLEDEKNPYRKDAITTSFNNLLSACQLKDLSTEARELFSERYHSFLA